MREKEEKRYCQKCQEKTLHVIKEYALEIEYQCEECNQQEQIVKTFF